MTLAATVAATKLYIISKQLTLLDGRVQFEETTLEGQTSKLDTPTSAAFIVKGTSRF